MRFRRLNLDELKSLEQEFISFLAVSGIEAKDWEDFKTSNPSFCDDKIDEFSDVVIGTILTKAKYAEHRSERDWMLFKFEDEMIHLIILHSDDINLMDIQLNEAHLDDISIHRTSKPYHPNKEDELFKMMQQGCVITEGTLYESIR